MNLREKPFYLGEQQAAWVENTLDAMTTEEKVGQLFCVMGGDYDPETLKSMVAQGKVGGVLFRPVQTGAEIRSAFDELDAMAKIPILKAANLEEGGSGGRSDGTLYGWPMLVGATGDPEEARRFGWVCGAEGAEAGINWSFSPVCDLSLNHQNPITNVRSFGSDLELVRKMTLAYSKSMEERGVMVCAKHFPGDGVDYRDQHLHPTVNSLTSAEWHDTYGQIYRSLIENGLSSIMVGHIAQPDVAKNADPTLSVRELLMPATLNPTLLTVVLRGELGFNGLITSDATIMGGYTMAMPRREALSRSVMAGCDMLVFNTDFEEDYGYLMDAVADGRLTVERLNDAVRRILALKARASQIASRSEPVPTMKWRRNCADKAITLVKNNQQDALPVTPERYPKVRLITLGQNEIVEGDLRKIAENYLRRQGFQVELYDPMADDLHGTSALPKDRVTLYFANYEQASNQTVVRAQWCPKHALDMPRFVHEEVSVFVSLANPYLIQDVPRVKTYINAYTATRDTIELTIDKLMGKSDFCGSSPVDPFCGLPDTRL